MNLVPIQDYLASKGFGQAGKTIFIFSMPDQASEGILLMEPLTGAVADHELPGYFRASFQAVIRNASYEAGKAKALEVMKALTFNQETKLGSMAIKQCLPRHLPIAFQRTPGNSLEFSVNFDVKFVDLSL